MKIAGKSGSARAVKRVSLPREGGVPIEVTIQALPLGFEDKVFEWIPSPPPPKKYAMKNGKAFKDREGQYVVEVDEANAEFLARARKAAMLQAVALLHEALKADPEVKWDALEPPSEGGEKREEFYAKIYEELRVENFTTGDIRLLLAELNKISNKSEDLAAAREGF